MGLDGFSMGNLGLNAELTSAQMANQAEHLAKKETEFKIKDVTTLSEDKGVKRKEENDTPKSFKHSDKQEQEQNQDSEFQDESEDSTYGHADTLGFIDEETFLEKNPKEFSVRINPITGHFELVSKKDNKVLETISPKDLMGLVSHLNSASGILVNRKI